MLFQLVQYTELEDHTFQGSVLEDLFTLLSNLLDTSVYWPLLTDFNNNTPPTSESIN